MAHEIALKYGCNPNQKPARIFMEDGGAADHGALRPAGIHQLSRCASTAGSWCSELKRGDGHCPPPPRFKHVSPAGAAIGLPLPRRAAKESTLSYPRIWSFRRWPAPMPARAARTACPPSAIGLR